MKQMEEVMGISFTLLFVSFIVGLLATAYAVMFSLLAYAIDAAASDALWRWAGLAWKTAGCASIAFGTMIAWILASMAVRGASARKR